MFARMAGRTGVALALSALVVTGSGLGAYAHECINSSRSAHGNEAAGSHSQAWFTLRVTNLLAEDIENGLYSEEDGQCILAAYTATGSPLSFTVHVKGVTGQDGTLLEHNKNAWLRTNGKGIDHFLDLYGGAIVQSFDACGVTPPF
jgi:hypothetical protein